MRSRRLRFLVFCLFTLVGFLAGCTTTPSLEKEVQAAAPLTVPDFEDVPIPAGFTKKVDESVLWETTAFRAGFLVYEGEAETIALTEFFKANMTANGWRMLSNFQGREAVMVFLKGDRNCLITISQKPAGTRLEVMVGPPVQGSKP